ncbi:MAG: GAF domain-containing protein [Deltaproteobacteria bacterium]|nr:GAF domain-containing protein [Deltaproteobacteria bacterium]
MRLLYSIPPFLTLCCFVSLACLSASRGRKKQINRLFTVICILGAFLYIDILVIFNCKSSQTALFISRLDHFFIVYLIPLYIHFFHAYLKIPGRLWLIRTAYFFAFILMCFTPTPLFIAEMQRHSFGYFGKGGALYVLMGIETAGAAVYVLILIHQAIQRETQSVLKNRLKYLFCGFGILGFLIGMNTLPLLGYTVYPPGNFSFIPLSIFAVGLFRYDLLDMGLLIRKSVIYSILSIMLTLIYALVVTVIHKSASGIDISNSVYFPIFFFILVVVIFGPVKTRIQILVDRYFFKGRYEYRRTIKQLSQTISAVLDIQQIAALLIETISGSMQVSHCCMYLSDDAKPPTYVRFRNNGDPSLPTDAISENSPLVIWMKRRLQPLLKDPQMQQSEDAFSRQVYAELESIRAAVVFPLIFENTLIGILAIGDKKSGDLFLADDLDLLETLASQSSLSIENARAYRKIEDLNKNLEKKVSERTLELQTALVEKEKAMEVLIRSESLAAIGTLVAGTAHELNNPLASAMSLIQSTLEDLSARNDTPLNSAIQDDLAFAGKELARAKAIVGSLLGLSRQTQTYDDAIDLNTVVKDALQMLRNLYKNQKIEISEQYAGDLPLVYGNFASLGQVVLNIIQNAVQAAAPSSGTIFLKTDVDRNHHQVIFECEDTGPGIPDAIRQDIFKPFFTTKAVGKGTGLGLYICHDIVERHGGTLALEKSRGKGARFVVKLLFES